jgi:hypothetical protein
VEIELKLESFPWIVMILLLLIPASSQNLAFRAEFENQLP